MGGGGVGGVGGGGGGVWVVVVSGVWVVVGVGWAVENKTPSGMRMMHL